MILVIDDEKTFPFPDDVDVKYARTLKDGFKQMQEGLDELWLDYDLGIVDGEEQTIKPLCLMLEEAAFNGNPWSIGRIVICSLNVVGVEWIYSTLFKYYDVVICNDPKSALEVLDNKQVKWY